MLHSKVLPAANTVAAVSVCRRAKDLVQGNIELLHKIAAKLMENEQVDGEELQAMIFSENSEQYMKDDASVTIPYREPVAA